MAAEHIRAPLAQSLNEFAKGKAADATWLVGKRWPCVVSKVIGSGIVEVNFQVNPGPFTLPRIQVPIAYPEYIRYPIQVGDKGFCGAADARLGGITGLGPGVPDLSQPGNLTGLMFYWLGNTAWTAPDDTTSTIIYGAPGVIIRDKDKQITITVTSDGLAIDLTGGDLTITAHGNTVTVTDGDVIADGISLKTHRHGGVSTGTGDTGEPIS